MRGTQVSPTWYEVAARLSASARSVFPSLSFQRVFSRYSKRTPSMIADHFSAGRTTAVTATAVTTPTTTAQQFLSADLADGNINIKSFVGGSRSVKCSRVVFRASSRQTQCLTRIRLPPHHFKSFFGTESIQSFDLVAASVPP